MNTPQIYIGTTGWAYPESYPVFYPKKQTKFFNWLRYYSDYFNVVEVNTTFYQFLKPQNIDDWLHKINDVPDFSFIIKLHQIFTHKRKISHADIKATQEILDILQQSERLAGLLIQFPYSFECSDVNILYMKMIIDLFSSYTKFIEVRHPSWKNKKAKTITFCSVDLPQVGDSIPFMPGVSNNISYLRFHGRNKEGWNYSIKNSRNFTNFDPTVDRYEYYYSTGELLEISQQIKKQVYDKAKKIFIIWNNHPHIDAVSNALELRSMLNEDHKVRIPKTILNVYPRLNRAAV